MKGDKKKGNEIIIKCTKCGFKYYKGDVHDCRAVRDPELIGVVNVEEKIKKEERVHTPKAERKVYKNPQEILQDLKR